jgi:16S rRNA (adenine1518-N6/adenine1519-N6)-dimethyltransferase
MILQRIALIPQKKRGQNFLASDKIAEQIVEAASLQVDDFVVEIGPGLGMVTEKILKAGAHVLAIEIDEKLVTYLKDRFAQQPNLQVIRNDFLSLAPEVLHPYNGSKQPTFITNPPYRGAKKILKRILTMNRAKAIVITLQQEVAEAALTPPGTKGATALSYFVHYRFFPQKLFDIPQNFFYPEPGINSKTLLLTPHQGMQSIDEPFFFRAVEQLMRRRKRLLKNAMKGTYHLPTAVIDELFSSAGVASTARAHELPIDQMVALTNGIKNALSP